MLKHYLVDLVVSVTVVLLVGWWFETSASDQALRDALVTQNDVYAAISRFTPYNLFTSYLGTVDLMTRGIGFGYYAWPGFSGAVQHALGTAGLLVLTVGLAIPDTLVGLYQDTTGTAALVVLAGFGLAPGTVFTALLAAKTSTWRLLLGVVLSPLAISVEFLALQAFMLAMLDVFFWVTTLAPYAVGCPVLCTLYWVAFPNADRGATAWIAHGIFSVFDFPAESRRERFSRR